MRADEAEHRDVNHHFVDVMDARKGHKPIATPGLESPEPEMPKASLHEELFQAEPHGEQLREPAE